VIAPASYASESGGALKLGRANGAPSGELPPAVRRELLLRRSAELRVELGTQLAAWQRPLNVADQLRHSWHWVRENPQWPLAALVVVVAVRPRRAWRWIGRGLWLWRAWRFLRPVVQAATGSNWRR
jgi:YqjK-like protein